MTEQLTTGPWFIKGPNAGGGFNIEAPSGRRHWTKRIAHTVSHEPARGSNDVGITREEAEANARVIVAAPDLLKACQAALKIWLDDPRTPNGGVADSLQAAITKATQPGDTKE